MKSGQVIIGRFISYCIARVSYKGKISRLLNRETKEVDKIYREISESKFMEEITYRAGNRRTFFNFSMSCVLRAPTLYALCRILQPEIVVETGVADGYSSAFILNALEANKKGHLYSIDLPNQPGQELGKGRVTGWLVPEALKMRWTLILGSSKEKLPALLENLKKVDIFYHDSEHSYENMIFEFKEALACLGKDSLILSDDITDNRAFDDFCDLTHLKNLRLFKLGIIKR